MTFLNKHTDFQSAALSAALTGLRLEERLRVIRAETTGRLVLTTSFGLEDQALTHAAAEAGIAISFATLDTGRLFDETLELWAETEMRYGFGIQSFTPDSVAVETLLRRDGPLGFRGSIAARQACCAVRKIGPLGRALEGASGWVTGLRADQSAARSVTPFVAFDPEFGVTKISPLADWSRDQVVRYVADNGVPYNALHDRGFLSIGCAPCTRAVQAGEPERAGRWWWEDEGKKECGLHDRLATATSPLSRPIV